MLAAALCLGLFGSGVFSQESAPTSRPSPPERREFVVDGVARSALIAAPRPSGDAKPPLVFVFHGHGGTARQVLNSYGLRAAWPEALIVAMQGLPTPGITDPEGKKAGWQNQKGQQGDRDLAFFDAVYAALAKENAFDKRRVYSTGHSNGGGFTYLLWAERPTLFAAFAPSSAGAAGKLLKLVPKPAMHIAGTEDPIVPYANQRRTMNAVRLINRTENQGEAWSKEATLYASSGGTPFLEVVHSGGHEFHRPAVELMVRFLKLHALPETKPADSRPAAQPDRSAGAR